MNDEADKPTEAEPAPAPAAESIEMGPAVARTEPEPPMPKRPMMGIVVDDPDDRADEAKKKAKPRAPFDPGYGGGVGFLFVVLGIAGLMAMGMTLRVERPAKADVVSDEPVEREPGEPGGPATTAETEAERRKREDEALLRPPPIQEKRKPGTFFGIPTE